MKHLTRFMRNSVGISCSKQLVFDIVMLQSQGHYEMSDEAISSCETSTEERLCAGMNIKSKTHYELSIGALSSYLSMDAGLNTSIEKVSKTAVKKTVASLGSYSVDLKDGEIVAEIIPFKVCRINYGSYEEEILVPEKVNFSFGDFDKEKLLKKFSNDPCFVTQESKNALSDVYLPLEGENYSIYYPGQSQIEFEKEKVFYDDVEEECKIRICPLQSDSDDYLGTSAGRYELYFNYASYDTRSTFCMKHEGDSWYMFMDAWAPHKWYVNFEGSDGYRYVQVQSVPSGQYVTFEAVKDDKDGGYMVMHVDGGILALKEPDGQVGYLQWEDTTEVKDEHKFRVEIISNPGRFLNRLK